MRSTSLRRCELLFGVTAFLFLGASSLRAQALAPNLLYTSVQPCRVFDTRFATNGTNGRLIHGVSQTFNVVGNNADPYFSGQGGHSGGCSLPGFAFVHDPQIQAVVLNFVAINSAGGGDLLAWPTDQAPPNSSIINYANSGALGGLNIANGIVVPVRQDTPGGDISLKAQVSDTDVLADVVGYFSNGSPVQGAGFYNLFLGLQAGNPSVTTGNYNTALGVQALSANTTGLFNTALGWTALNANTTGFSNLALGPGAMSGNTTGTNNIAIGPGALELLKTGTWNIKIGGFGSAYTGAESSNIIIGNDGQAGESNTIRIGTSGTAAAAQSSTFIAGINGVTSSGGTAVFVNTSGQLGTATSSLRFKEDVENMADASAGLMQLRPVTFRYKPAYDDGSHLLQYGLIAEEVAAVYPKLVQYDEEGNPLAVRYHFVNAMLLNEVQKQHRAIEEQRGQAMETRSEVTELRAQVQALKAHLERLEALLRQLQAVPSVP
jgi:hypothetical protein